MCRSSRISSGLRALAPLSRLRERGWGRGFGVDHNTLSRPAGTLGFGILRRPTSCIHAVVSHKWERVISFGPSGRF
ncbi:hypothetical protein FVE88_20975 [Ectopseudomonas mendocina]|nr:hypothetical protein FVE88_20975 [Pseudomonas mendocina]